jgi:pyruvate ferredoxin oxidoreductase alpha subunit
VLFNIAGMRLPIVMTCANRALSSPLSIWNDQQDSMSMRDVGWIQLHCADNQEAVDTTIQAYRIAERTELPVMVCMDGFTLTHTLEGIDIPTQKQVDRYLPPYQFSRTLDPRNPMTLGTCVSPDFYTEARHSQHQAMLRSQEEIVAADQDWFALTGRKTGGLLTVEGPEQAKVAILAVGSVVGTLQAALEELPPPQPVKLIKLRSFRPFPIDALKDACRELDDVIVLERALSPGMGGIVGLEVLAALAELPNPPRVHNFATGLGGRDIPLQILPRLLAVLSNPGDRRFRIIDVDLEKLPVEDR